MTTNKSIRARCLAEGKTLAEYNRIMKRISRGMDVEDAFSLKSYQKADTVDHKGEVYKNKNEMLEHYGIASSTFRSRIDAKWSLEDALTKSSNLEETE